MAQICIDTLAGAKYPEVIAKLPRKYGIGIFWDTFGLAKNLIAQEAAAGRSLIRVQGQWSTTHTFNSTQETKAIEIGKELQKIAVRNPKTKIEYSLFCEHRRPASFMVPVLKKVQIHCPNVALVNSPISGGEWVEGFKNEIHNNDKPRGMPKGKYNFSFDGLHQLDCNVELYKDHLTNPNCEAYFAWSLQNNCKRNSKDATPPAKRNCKPTPDLHNSLIFQLENGKQKVELQAGWISKSHSEQHNDVDPRANKLVLIGPKGKRFKSVRVGSLELTNGGLTEEKDPAQRRNTWRSDKWAYKLGRVLQVYADGKLVGTIDAPFRQNEWREKT